MARAQTCSGRICLTALSLRLSRLKTQGHLALYKEQSNLLAVVIETNKSNIRLTRRYFTFRIFAHNNSGMARRGQCGFKPRKQPRPKSVGCPDFLNKKVVQITPLVPMQQHVDY
jgi:hypothetical protein